MTRPVRIDLHSHGLADYPAGSGFGPRTLGDHEFVWIVSGTAQWEVDGRRHRCPPGSVLCCRPGQRDSFLWDPRRRTRHGFIHFGIEDPGDLPAAALWPEVLPTVEGDILIPLLEHALWLWGQADGRTQCTETVVLALRAYASARVGTDRSPPSPHEHPLVEGLMQDLLQRWGDGPWSPPAIDALAAGLGVTRAQLGRVLRRELGVTPQELLRLLRLDRAASLLGRGDLAVQEIARLCGFESPFHFSRRFKARFGLAPRAFRAHILAGGNAPGVDLVRVRQVAQRLWQRQQPVSLRRPSGTGREAARGR